LLNGEFLIDYYSAYSSAWVDRQPIQSMLKTDGALLWIGSYFELLEKAPLMIVDLDPDALTMARKRFEGSHLVQADIRQLPLRGGFDRVMAPGCVTAYLLDDQSLQHAARSLVGALSDQPDARLLLDAYDRDSILNTEYFAGDREVMIRGQRWLRQARTVQVSTEPFVFDVTLDFSCPDELPQQFSFRQRAFAPQELADALLGLGLQVVQSHRDSVRGRFYQVFARPPQAS
jgi:hypothetical protein